MQLASNVKTTSEKKGGKSKSKVKGQTMLGGELSGSYKSNHHTNNALCLAALQGIGFLYLFFLCNYFR